MTANLSIIRASRGMCSQISRPGTLVGIGLYSPRIPRGVRLEVEHVLVRRAARQEDHDDRLVRADAPPARFGPEQLRQRSPPRARPPSLEIAPGNPVAKPILTLSRNGRPIQVGPSALKGCVSHRGLNDTLSSAAICKGGKRQRSTYSLGCGPNHPRGAGRDRSGSRRLPRISAMISPVPFAAPWNAKTRSSLRLARRGRASACWRSTPGARSSVMVPLLDFDRHGGHDAGSRELLIPARPRPGGLRCDSDRVLEALAGGQAELSPRTGPVFMT